MPKIKNMGAGTARFKEGMYISGSAHQSDGTDSDFSLVVSGSIKVESGAGSQPGITFQKGEDDIHFIRFAADDDGTSSNATLTYQQAEHIFIQPGRGGDFYIQARTTESSDPFTFPFSVMDNGTARFEKGLSDSSFRNTNLTDDVTFFVSGSDDNLNNAVFGGNVVVSGSIKDGAGNVYSIGGGGSSKHFAYGHCDLETNNKPVNWINAASVSSSAAEKTWFIVPFAATLDKIIITVKANNFSTANDGNITLNVYKNQPNFNATIISQTVGADDFTEKVSNMNGNSDCNQKIFSGLNASLAEADLIQMKVGKSAGSEHEALVTMIFVG